MANVLICWELGQALGHVMMQRPVAQAFLERGHKVFVALRDFEGARTAFGDLPVTLLPAPIKLERAQPLIKRPLSFVHILHNTGMYEGPELAARVDAWRTLFDLVQPELIVCDHSPTALLASRGLPLKRVVYGTGFYSPPSVSPLPTMCPWVASTPDQLAADERRVLDVMNRQLKRLGGPPLASVSSLYREVDENFIAMIPELDHFGARKGVRYWGCRPETEGATPNWPEGDGPRIFGYLKPCPALPKLLELLKRRGTPTLIHGNWVNPAEKQRWETPTLRLSREPYNLPRAARECDLAILHATATSTFTFLIAGKRMLQLPFHLEQQLTARRTVRLRSGLAASTKNIEEIEHKLLILLEQPDRFIGPAKIAEKYARVNWQRLHQELLEKITGHVA
jgi:hypothetical protein